MIKISKEFGMIVVTKDDTEVLRTNKLVAVLSTMDYFPDVLKSHYSKTKTVPQNFTKYCITD